MPKLSRESFLRSQPDNTTLPSTQRATCYRQNILPTNIHTPKMGGWSVDSERVRELEVELDGIRSAFQDYIANSRDLETGLDHELGNMRRFLIR